ncbi:MAG TPA: hypothetical protein VHZ74_00545 [Bryobacteraceae bacterium]|nr:hypothetical protein [Bryobacteraceae bacterium]
MAGASFRPTGGHKFCYFRGEERLYLGEPIPLQPSFTSTQPNGYRAETRLQDRVGRLNDTEEFLVDPAALTDDLRGLPGETGGMEESQADLLRFPPRHTLSKSF